ALEDQCTNQGLKLTTNFDDQEINPELGCDLEELHNCKQEAMNANLYYELRETAWWNWGKILLDMLLDTLPLDPPLREGLLEDAIDSCEDNTATNCPLEKLAIIVNQVLKLQHNTTSEVCETTLSKCITALESKLRHTKRAQEKNTSPSWSESFGQSFIGRTVLHYLHSTSAITNVFGTVSRAQAERTKLQAYRSHFHKNLDALQSMLPPNLSNKVEILVKNPDWDQAKKEVQRFVDWNVNLDKKLAQNEKEVNNSNAITTFSPLTTQNIEIVYRNREQEQNSKSTWLPSLGAEAVNVSYTYMQKQTEKSMRKEFDHWMNRSQEEKTIKRVKRNLDRPIESPATSVAEFTSFISGEMELIPQPEFDAYISRIAKSGFSSADAQQGFKKLLGAMDTVDKINSLKAPNLSNQGHELKMRIVAAT
ncbi:hypothetical protein, partial [Candidatus Ichthyocystis hellenicum]|uniref:hypothetical protein n=2 Tax=Candidatus Ichthyocystis TaxID=2929841 RepID=UPI0015857014